MLAGTALVFGGVELIATGSSHQIAAGALFLAAMAIWWSVTLGAALDNKVERIERDVRRIADAVARDRGAAVESASVPDRLDRVNIRVGRDLVEIPWSSRDALLGEIAHLESGKQVVAAFEAVGATRPVELDVGGMALLVEAIHVMGNNAGGLDRVPPKLFGLRNALVNELHDRT